MNSYAATLVRTRRAPSQQVTAGECRKALGLLLGARDAKGVSPLSCIAPSACRLLLNNGWERPGRASYILHLLEENGVIRQVEHSRKYEILREDLPYMDLPEIEEKRPAIPTPRDLAPVFESHKIREKNALIGELQEDLERLTEHVAEVSNLLTRTQAGEAALREHIATLGRQLVEAHTRARRAQSAAYSAQAANIRLREQYENVRVWMELMPELP